MAKKLLLIIGFLLIITATLNGQQYDLKWVCINSGGNISQSSNNFGARLTIAQPIIGVSQSSNFYAHLGLWQPAISLALPVEDVEEMILPTTFQLSQNFPNPFNPNTTIEFIIPKSMRVKLVIYNTMGQIVAILVDQPIKAGFFRVKWDGSDYLGNSVASGVYFYKLTTEGFTDSKKMLLLR